MDIQKYIDYLITEMNKAREYGKHLTLKEGKHEAAKQWFCIAATYEDAIEKANELVESK